LALFFDFFPLVSANFSVLKVTWTFQLMNARLARVSEFWLSELGELAARWTRTSLADPLLGFSNMLSELYASLSGCHSLSETPPT